MNKKLDVCYHPNPEYRFWLYDPEGDGMMYYRTAEDRYKAAEECIKTCLDYGYGCWLEEVNDICAGELTVTHKAQVTDKTMRPPEVDEDGFDGEGKYWPEGMEWRGTYTLELTGEKDE